jgi:hypothetical protein
MWRTLGVLGLLLCLSGVEALAVVLAWDRSPSTSVIGYLMSYGPAGGVYDTELDVGDVSQVSIGGLTPGHSYDFAVRAYDGEGHESVYSNEVTYTVPLSTDTQPPVVTLTNPVSDKVVARGDPLLLSADASDDTGVVWVRFLVQGQVHCEVPQPPYQCPWRVPNAANKRYPVQAIAGDAAGRIGYSVVVTVSTTTK